MTKSAFSQIFALDRKA